MSTDDPKDEYGRDNGASTAEGHETTLEEARASRNNGEDSHESEEEDDDMSDGETSEEEADSNILVIKGDEKEKEGYEYKGDVPPPPVELYHGAQAQVIDTVNGKSISYIKISYKKNLKKSKGQLVSAGKLIQELFGNLQKSSDTLMLTPISNKGNYIDQPIHVPLTNAAELRKYFSYTLEREEVRGVFVVRSEKSLWHLKQNPVVSQYLRDNDVWLSGTRWLTEKRKETFFISGAHQTLGNKEDLISAIKDNMEGESQFSVYPGRRNVGDRTGKTTFRAPIIDLLLDEYETGVSNIQRAFANSVKNKDIRLKNMNLVPLRPSLTISTEVIRNGAQKHNKLNMRLDHRVVRGITNLDIELTKTRGGAKQTLREFFDEQKYTSGGEAQQIFYRTERTSFDRIFMIFEKTNRTAAETFLKTIHKRLRNVFTQESLDRVRGEQRDTRVGEINTYTDENSIANDRALLAAFGNPQEEESNRYNKPVERERRRTFVETFDERDFPKMNKKAWGSGRTVEKVKTKESEGNKEIEIIQPNESEDEISNLESKTTDVTSVDRFLKRMDNFEKNLEAETKKNDKNLNAIFEGTEKLYQKMRLENQKSVDNMTTKIEAFTINMLERDREREKAQVQREKERDRAQERMIKDQLSQTHKLIESLAKKVAENERKIQERVAPTSYPMPNELGTYPPDNSWPTVDIPQESERSNYRPPVLEPTTLEGQLIRKQITQNEYDWAKKESDTTTLQGKSKGTRDLEKGLRYQLLLDRIQVRRTETAERVAQAVQEAKEGEPYPNSTSSISRADAELAKKTAQEKFTTMDEEEIVEMEEKSQSPESPRRKREQSANSENKKQHTEEDTQTRERTYSDGSTFVEGFHPPEETIQSQTRTEALQTQIREAEEAKTRQRQVDLSQTASEESDNMAEMIESIANPEEGDIPISITPGAMMEIDLDRNEEKISAETNEAGDPARRLGPQP